MYEKRKTKRVLSGALAAGLMLTAGSVPKGVSAEPMRPMVPEREREWEDIAPPVMTSDAVYDFAGGGQSGFDPAADTIITTPYTSVVTALARKRQILAEVPKMDRPFQERVDAVPAVQAPRLPAERPVSDVDARLHELYAYYVNRDRGQDAPIERGGVQYDYGPRSGNGYEVKGVTANASSRKGLASPERKPMVRHIPQPKDTFYSKLETVDMGGLALRILLGAQESDRPRAFGLAVEPESYGLDAQSTFFFPASSAKELRKMLENAAERYTATPVGERLGSFFRPDPLGKVGIEVLKSLDGEGRVVLSLFARPRAGNPKKFHAQMMREAGLPEREIAKNLAVYGSEPVNLHGLFESAGRFLNYAETEVSAGKLRDYAAGIAKLFGGE